MIIMKNMAKVLLLQVALFCAACGGNKLGSSSADVAITIDSICLDTVTVDYVENCSYTGFVAHPIMSVASTTPNIRET